MPLEGKLFLAKMELREAIRGGKKIWFNNLNLKIQRPEDIEQLTDMDLMLVYNEICCGDEEDFDGEMLFIY